MTVFSSVHKCLTDVHTIRQHSNDIITPQDRFFELIQSSTLQRNTERLLEPSINYASTNKMNILSNRSTGQFSKQKKINIRTYFSSMRSTIASSLGSTVIEESLDSTALVRKAAYSSIALAGIEYTKAIS